MFKLFVIRPKIFMSILFFLVLGITLINPVSFSTSKTTSYLNEDQSNLFQYNVTANVSYIPGELPLTFSFENITSNLYSETVSSFYSWISINTSTGVVFVNSTLNNQTGRFNASVKVLNNELTGSIDAFYFIVNASNDFPVFITNTSTYNLTQNETFTFYMNATDEESHYPLFFNITFLNNCTLPSGSVRSNCTLFNFINFSNTSAIMNYTPSSNDVGTYYANITVRDFGENYTCSSGYCLANYSQNRTTVYSSLVTFTVFSTLSINASDCNNRIFQQNQSSACIVNVTTKSQTSTINFSSLAILRNYNGNVSNKSWFYSENITNSQNFSSIIFVNFTPGYTEVGNWTINISVFDLNYSQNRTQPVYVYVNKTLSDSPEVNTIPNKITSINLLTRINITVYDDELLIPDKNNSSGGYNETISISRSILNQSNLSQQLNLSNFSIQIVNMPVYGTNRTEAKIDFTPNLSDAGNYTINVTISDLSGSLNFTMFNLTILNNEAPQWNESLQTIAVVYEGNLTYLNLSLNASDPDGDPLNFSFSNYSEFPSFSVNLTRGIINFTPLDSDVGEQLVNITITDGYLTNTTVFNFTIYNVNDNVSIEKPLLQSDITNATFVSSKINCSEDNYTIIGIWIQDDDFKIPSSQRDFYNESLNLSVVIQGRNTNLLNFTKNNAFPTTGSNRSKYEAIFTPNKSDVGSYNFSINVSDLSGSSDVLYFNLTVFETFHNPVLSNLSNITTAVNRSIYTRINVSDVEDGTSISPGNLNFTFNYTFINGTDFINENGSIFNTSTGVLNFTFNSSHGGIYRINITVNDSSDSRDSYDFWIYVYNIPSINLPLANFSFYLSENVTSNLSFNVNHSVLDNLTYYFYLTSNVNNILRYNISSYGNGLNMSWSFSPNFTDSINNGNLTLVVFSSNNQLANNTILNSTKIWNITINHTNYPLVFSGTIGGIYQEIVGTSPLSITLSDYFMDLDAVDYLKNQTVGFSYTQYSSNGSAISVSFQNWTNGTTPKITFSSSSTGSIFGRITAYEYNLTNSSLVLTNQSSNNFTVNLSVSTATVQVPTSGGGSSSPIPISLKIIVPTDVSAFRAQRVDIPLTIGNRGTRALEGVNITARGFNSKNHLKNVQTSLDRGYFLILKPKESYNITLTLYFEKDDFLGVYEVIVNGTSKSPKFDDWAKIVINLQELNTTEVEKYLIFTEEFIVQNPQCIELKELIDEAKESMDKGQYNYARLKAEEAVRACEESISQVSIPRSSTKEENKLPLFLVICLVGSFVLGIGYYFIKRIMFERMVFKNRV